MKTRVSLKYFPSYCRRSKNNNKFSALCNLITRYNPLLPNIKTIIKKHLPVLHRSNEMLQIFPESTVNITFRGNKNVKELISPSVFPRTIKENNCSIENGIEDAIFVKIFLCYLLGLLGMLPNRATNP